MTVPGIDWEDVLEPDRKKAIEILKREFEELDSRIAQLTEEIAEAESIAVRDPKYTNVGKLQKLKEWRAILQGQLITNQNRAYKLREAEKK